MSYLENSLRELEGAEEFLEFFAIPFDSRIVQVYRLHILQRFHDYLSRLTPPEEEAERHALYREQLSKAYADFINSSAQAERALKVFKEATPGFVALGEITRG
ncbi:nitrogenase-stabilizing/protective protein NifW [Pseudomonas kuykendallii]|uniref:nitrogenase-stabilizing/protective protein NifW n=1 Tax=Pseudomonas kuykendallii TaxID=1007099 RepID=UPI0028D26522|nr:nitrogenase-stabilizing/protective protein NifW [Pseudomonas kuykendallii]